MRGGDIRTFLVPAAGQARLAASAARKRKAAPANAEVIDVDASPQKKRPRAAVRRAAAGAAAKGTPVSVLAWNVNGLRSRLAMHSAGIAGMVQAKRPDLIFLSEVRGLREPRGDKVSREEQALLAAAFEPSGCFAGYEAVWSLSSSRYAGTAMLRRTESLQPPVRVWYSLPDDITAADAQPQHPDGRIILAEWEALYTLHAYVPNNGSSEAAFERRRLWDAATSQWLAKHWGSGSAAKPLVYCGDLNVAPDPELDLSHPGWMRKVVFQDAAAEGDRGQPGCTPNECARFRGMLEAGRLVDAYRAAHPAKPDDVRGAVYSWRGTPAKPPLPPEAGRYFMKGMRIDHFLVSEGLAGAVESCEILGRGESCKDPSFVGSDHSPMTLVLRGSSVATAA
eukprot:TRINITY_DN2843_c0_g2_i1.p1 TRINITY_DN2843_c0_g2~~TRINITY_DN2843_c0_g2_i1.p1  ORF type:complete len:394 (+),score=118.44 TRINITY_DN2843_c0_g2_i1:76-1257(+)